MRPSLGLCSVYRGFGSEFAKITALLYRTLKKRERNRFAMNEHMWRPIDELKNLLISPPVLGISRVKWQCTVDTAASSFKVGCVLLQEQEEKVLNPIGYWSRSLCNAEHRYDKIHKECLTVKRSVHLSRTYIDGFYFVIRTDHQKLRWSLYLKEATGRLARWRLCQLQFGSEVVHRPRMYHRTADTMSWLPRKQTVEETWVDDDILTIDVSRNNENNLPVVCAVTNVKAQIPNEVALL